MKVLIFDLRESEKQFFYENSFPDFEFEFFEKPLNEKTKIPEDLYKDTVAISAYRSSIINKNVIDKFKNLRIIATRSYDFSHIDINYCTKNNIAVLNTDQYGEIAVAEYALGLIIALTRKIKPAIVDISEKNVNPKLYEGELLNKKTIGIIGCGKVGKELAKIANFFDMRVLISSYKERLNLDMSCNIVPFDNLLAESDIIFLHMPFSTETYKILGKEEFNKMKEGSYIINTSSVELIDLEALYDNLLSGKIKGAGLDILDSDFSKKISKELGNETMNTKGNTKITSKLLDMPNVIITPHIAYNTKESINYVLTTTMNNIKDAIKGIRNNRIC